MRAIAEETLSSHTGFVSVNGKAHSSLNEASVDLVTVGQALHWFDPQLTAREFARILKQKGTVMIVYNDRNKDDPIMRAYEAVVSKHERDRKAVPDVNDEYF